jgi:hypothetical protein
MATMKCLPNVCLSAIVVAFGMNLYTTVDLHYGWITTSSEEKGTLPKSFLMLPTKYMQSHFVDTLGVPTKFSNESSTPIFWHVPKSGGTTMKDLGSCLGLIVADEWGMESLSKRPASLDILKRSGKPYVNIDAISVEGMKRAHELGFAENQPANAIFTPRVREAAEYLFDDEHQGTVFALLRHPVSRAISLYYYLQKAHWEVDYDPKLKNVTLEDFADSTANNPMTRSLLGKKQHEMITRIELNQAKDFLSTKVLIGLSERMRVSVQRFGHYFGTENNGWDDNEKWKECSRKAINQGSNKNPHPAVDENTSAWKALAEANKYDMELYQLAVDLFRTQGISKKSEAHVNKRSSVKR